MQKLEDIRPMHDDDCEQLPRIGNINISNDAERTRWARAFKVTEAVLVQAVKIVGTSVSDLRRLFCRD
jgi:hypothetical protein